MSSMTLTRAEKEDDEDELSVERGTNPKIMSPIRPTYPHLERRRLDYVPQHDRPAAVPGDQEIPPPREVDRRNGASVPRPAPVSRRRRGPPHGTPDGRDGSAPVAVPAQRRLELLVQVEDEDDAVLVPDGYELGPDGEGGGESGPAGAGLLRRVVRCDEGLIRRRGFAST